MVGAGILGLAHAYHLARRGRRVIVFERIASRHRAPRCGISACSGRSANRLGRCGNSPCEVSRSGSKCWRRVGLWHERTGSLHLAYRDDEAQVLREFAQEMSAHGEPVELHTPDLIGQRTSAVKHDGLRLALWSPHEVCVDPREVMAGLPHWLSSRFGVVFEFGRTITAVEMPASSRATRAGRPTELWICSGDELNLLFADQFDEHGLVRCKLQMMRSDAYGQELRIGPMLAAGLTLTPLLLVPKLSDACRPYVAGSAEESPWLDRYGIHVLVSQNGRGELTIGDSHEYGDLDRALRQDRDRRMDHGLSCRHFLTCGACGSPHAGTELTSSIPTLPYVHFHPLPRVTAITGVGGAGMTLSFGLAEQVVAHELGEIEGPFDEGNSSHDGYRDGRLRHGGNDGQRRRFREPMSPRFALGGWARGHGGAGQRRHGASQAGCDRHPDRAVASTTRVARAGRC